MLQSMPFVRASVVRNFNTHTFFCLFLFAATGCGSRHTTIGAASVSSNTASGPNVAAITVDAGPAAAVGVLNEPFVSVTICPPADASNCQTIDHILVDTQSFGLRIIASVLDPTKMLPQLIDTNGSSIGECATFADGYSWGPVKTADVNISGETASNISVHVIGDASFAPLPATCGNTGAIEENTVASFGANGVLGVGVFIADCDVGCADAQNIRSGFYYACNGSTCAPTAVAVIQQVSNPAAFFSTDNNGVIVELPAIPNAGAAVVNGALIFGIGTQGNNSLGAATVLTPDPTTGAFTTTIGGNQFTTAFIDSGSNGIYFDDATIPTCSSNSGFYCPTSTLAFTATNTDNISTSTATINVANAEILLNSTSNYAFANLAGPANANGVVDWGLPFFFGRRVFTAIEGRMTMGGTGPYVAY